MEFDWSSILKPSGYRTDLSELESFESELGFSLPDDYKAFLLAMNGGKIFMDHAIHVPELSGDVLVNDLWSISAAHPSLGVKEGRDTQVRNRLGLRQAVRIGDDMGTGFFFLILDGTERGAIYFGFKDDLPMRESDWYSSNVSIPISMAKVSQSFTDLGKTIILNRLTA